MTPRTGWRIVLAAAVLFAVVAVAMDRRTSPPAFASFDQQLTGPSSVLPVGRPPDLADAWSGGPLAGPVEVISFYSVNRPLVLLCVGEPTACQRQLERDELLRSERVGAHDVTIAVSGYAVGLGPELLDHWKTVALTVDRPAWLDDPSQEPAA
jgi:hypothetical protein